MSTTLADLIEEHWREVTSDQIKPGDRVAVVYGPVVGSADYQATPDLIAAWRNDNPQSRFFVPEHPAQGYEPGTFARITAHAGASWVAFRAYDREALCWIDREGDKWDDSRVSHVEVIAYPDGTRPAPKVTEEDVESAARVMSENGWVITGTNPLKLPREPAREALEDFAARKFGGQA